MKNFLSPRSSLSSLSNNNKLILQICIISGYTDSVCIVCVPFAKGHTIRGKRERHAADFAIK